MKQLSIFKEPETKCRNSQERLLVSEDSLRGKPIKEQLKFLAAVFSDKGGASGWFDFSYSVGAGFDLMDVRECIIPCTEFISKRICEMFTLSRFPVDAPEEPLVPLPPPWWESMMSQPVNEPVGVKSVPFLLCYYARPEMKTVEVGRFRSQFVENLTIEERAVIRDTCRSINAKGFWPTPGIRTSVDEAPRKEMSEESKVRLRKGNAIRRALKKYGWFAREFLVEEYQRKGWTWGTEDDEIWEKAQEIKSKAKKSKKTKRKTDNDDLIGGAA